MAKYKRFLFGSKEKFAIAGKQWLDENQTEYIFGQFYFICDRNLIGYMETVVLTTPSSSLESFMNRYDCKIAKDLCTQPTEKIATQLYSIYRENYDNPAYEEQTLKYEKLFLTMAICESLDGTYVFLISGENKDILTYYDQKRKRVSHMILPYGNVFSVFREYIAFIDELEQQRPS